MDMNNKLWDLKLEDYWKKHIKSFLCKYFTNKSQGVLKEARQGLPKKLSLRLLELFDRGKPFTFPDIL